MTDPKNSPNGIYSESSLCMIMHINEGVEMQLMDPRLTCTEAPMKLISDGQNGDCSSNKPYTELARKFREGRGNHLSSNGK